MKTNREKEFYRAIGLIIRGRREHLGLSRADLGDAVGCSIELIAYYELGGKPLRAFQLFHIFNFLGINYTVAGDLFNGSSRVEGPEARRIKINQRRSRRSPFYESAMARKKLRA